MYSLLQFIYSGCFLQASETFCLSNGMTVESLCVLSHRHTATRT